MRRADRLDAENDSGQEVLLVGGGHALAGDLLHAEEAEAQLVLQQLADGADALVLQVVDVVSFRFAVDVRQHRLQNAGQVFGGQVADIQRDVHAELLVHEPASNLAKIVALDIEEEAVNKLPGRVFVGGLARSEPLVDVEQRFSRVRWWGRLQSRFDERKDVDERDRLRAPSTPCFLAVSRSIFSPFLMMTLPSLSVMSSRTRLPVRSSAVGFLEGDILLKAAESPRWCQRSLDERHRVLTASLRACDHLSRDQGAPLRSALRPSLRSATRLDHALANALPMAARWRPRPFSKP